MIQILKNGSPYVRALDSVAPSLLASLRQQDPEAEWTTAKIQMGRKPKLDRAVSCTFRLSREQANFIKEHGGTDLIRHLVSQAMGVAC